MGRGWKGSEEIGLGGWEKVQLVLLKAISKTVICSNLSGKKIYLINLWVLLKKISGRRAKSTDGFFIIFFFLALCNKVQEERGMS